MISNLASNALYRKYEEEKSLLELYGHVSSLTYEEWLETKKTNKTMESTIKWHTGEPKENGEYLVTLEDGSVCRDEWRELYCEDDIKCWVYNEGEVAAWCKLSDIEPYKEEKK